MKLKVILLILSSSCTLGSPSTLISASTASENATSSEVEEADGSSLPTPDGLSFIGSGYDLVKGNPDGQEIQNGGVDPGLLPAKRILEISYEENKKSDNNKYLVPDQMRFVVRDSCASKSKHDIVSNTEAYQNELKVSVSAEAEYDAGLWNAAFSASASYENMKKETTQSNNVFFENRTTCLKGNAEYFIDMAYQGAFSVSEPFASAVCNLPQVYNDKKYTNFLSSWGTNVVIGADLGTKEIIRRKSTQSEFAGFAMNNYAGSVSVSGGGGGFSGSLTVDVSKLSEEMKAGSKFGSEKTVFKVGGERMPEPVALRLVSIKKMFQINLYKKYVDNPNPRIGCVFSETMLQNLSSNIQQAIKDYPSYLNVDGMPTGGNVTVEIRWPKGTYALPSLGYNALTLIQAAMNSVLSGKPSVLPTGRRCPGGNAFTWDEGSYYQDSEDDNNKNEGSDLNSLGIMTSNGKDARQYFCVKTNPTLNNLPWPKGSYCIAKKGACPQGFDQGSVLWDDSDDDNKNKYNGVLPDGELLEDGPAKTVIDYCCRKDGFAAQQIFLPYTRPFILYPSKKGACQKVYKMTVLKQWYKWDIEDDGDNKGITTGSFPEGEYNRDLKMYYCVYTPEDESPQ